MSDAARDADEVAAYYAQGLERDRLDTGAGALELARTQLLLQRHLTAPPAVVADVGGGPGRYAVWLAERGYRVHLVDPVPLHVEQARAAARGRPGATPASAEVGGARAPPRGRRGRRRVPAPGAPLPPARGRGGGAGARAGPPCLSTGRCRHRRGDLALRLDPGRFARRISRRPRVRGRGLGRSARRPAP